MGTILSTTRVIYKTFHDLYTSYVTFNQRIARSPGLPRPNASIPYWTIPPSSISQHGAEDELPEGRVDIVILGSGITGTAVAKTLLDSTKGGKLRVVMLEARDACSGATARNGGHISPNTYGEYSSLKSSFGERAAKDILRFRLAHIEAIISAATSEREGLVDVLTQSQARRVQKLDVYLQRALFESEKNELKVFLDEFNFDDEGNGVDKKSFEVIEGEEKLSKFHFSRLVKGCISESGGAVHPYRFVTSILGNLLSRHPNFQLFTSTPCTSVASSQSHYVLTTPRGSIQASHVIHTANAWSSHLIPGLRTKIIPTKLHMSAHSPFGPAFSAPESSSQWNQILTESATISEGGTGRRISGGKPGERAYVFYPAESKWAFDYLTQLLPQVESMHPQAPIPNSSPTNPLPVSPSHYTSFPPTSGELMFGGGATLAGLASDVILSNIGVTSDSEDDSPNTVEDFMIETYLTGALSKYFASSCSSPSASSSQSSGSNLLSTWTGIMGLSADMQPWVGRIPIALTGREEPGEKQSSIAENERSLTSRPGEWISAGYSGEGMVHAWLCGRAVARMVIGLKAVLPCDDSTEVEKGKSDERGMGELSTWALPRQFIITEERARKANVETLMAEF